MIVTTSSVHGSPGATSWTLLSAGGWPSAAAVERVVLEADADGGVLAARYGLGVDPGVATLVAAVRRHDDHGDAIDLSSVARRLGESVWVIPSAESGERVVPVWGSSAGDVAAMAARDARVWLVDCGRAWRSTVAEAFVARSDLAIVVCGGRQEDLVAVPARVTGLQQIGAGSVGVLVVGRSAYTLGELGDFFGTGLVWQVRQSDDLVELASLVFTSRRARRSWVWREALEVAARIAERVTPIMSVAETPPPVGEVAAGG